MEYSEFRGNYELQHPASVPKLRHETPEYPSWLQFIVFCMFISAALISGVHTMSVVYATIKTDTFITEELRQWISRLTLIAFETALFVTVYALVKDRQRWIAWGAGGVAYLVTTIANIKNTADNLQPNSDILEWIVTFALGAGAPMIALLAGKLFVDMHRSTRAQRQLEFEKYQLALLEFDKQVNEAWQIYLTNEQVRENTEREAQRKHEAALARLQTKQTGQQTDKPAVSVRKDNRQTDKQALVRQWLEDNPDKRSKSVREIQSEMGNVVGHDLIAKVKRGMNGNGH